MLVPTQIQIFHTAGKQSTALLLLPWNKSINVSTATVKGKKKETCGISCQRATEDKPDALVLINTVHVDNITYYSFDCGLASWRATWDIERSKCQLTKQIVWVTQCRPGFYNTAGLVPPSVQERAYVCACAHAYVTHSLSRGTEVRLLHFWTMLAWFRREMWRVDGASRHGSPSTCTHRDDCWENKPVAHTIMSTNHICFRRTECYDGKAAVTASKLIW